MHKLFDRGRGRRVRVRTVTSPEIWDAHFTGRGSGPAAPTCLVASRSLIAETDRGRDPGFSSSAFLEAAPVRFSRWFGAVRLPLSG
jgi:hypothetical protein